MEKYNESAPLFENGDIVVNNMRTVAIYRGVTDRGVILYDAYMSDDSFDVMDVPDVGLGYLFLFKHATQEQKRLFLDKLKERGKRLNPETKEIEDVIKYDEIHFNPILEKFLWVNDIRDQFIYNWVNYKINDDKSIFYKEDVVSKAFHWDATDEGWNFWVAMDNQYREYYNDMRPPNIKDDPKVGDDVIMWNQNFSGNAVIDNLKLIKDGKYYGQHAVTNRCVEWDGTKEQFDSIRKK